MRKLLLYTRTPLHTDIYDPKLAYSAHLALKSEATEKYQPLNHNSGVFFASAVENRDGSLSAKSLRLPYALKLSGGEYLIAAVRTAPDGTPDETCAGTVLFALTEDFLSYKEVKTAELSCGVIDRLSLFNTCGSPLLFVTSGERNFAYLINSDYSLTQTVADNLRHSEIPNGIAEGIEGALPSCIIELPDETAKRLYISLTTPKNIAVEFPKAVKASSEEELTRTLAKVLYSDGSYDCKRIEWDLSGVDFSKPSNYEITGVIAQNHFEFPIAENRADPCIAYYKGSYYFIATNDADGNHTLYIRKADSLSGLVTAEEVLLLDSETYDDVKGLLWAPEFHEINGKLYIFFACTPHEFFYEESHIMELAGGGDPINKTDWLRPKRVTKSDGSPICKEGEVITLDMTEFEWQGQHYAVWSQRRFLPNDLGAWLYIAKINPDDPSRLLSEPVVLSKPIYGWANNHTFVDEGPFSLKCGDKLYLTYSSAAVDSTYCVSALILEKGKDPLAPHSWRKLNYPLLTSRSVSGEFGTGHNAYIKTEDGKIYNSYHARKGINAPRSSGIRRVHFNICGEPVLDMTEELDLNPDLREIKTVLIVG